MLHFYPAKIIRLSEFHYADFDYMMAMGDESYRLRFAVIDFSSILRLMPYPMYCKSGSTKVKEKHDKTFRLLFSHTQ